MGGVTGQEDPAGPPAGGDAGLEAVDEVTGDPHVVGAQVVVLAQEPPGGFRDGHLLAGLARQQGELESLTGRADVDGHVPACGIAVLSAVRELRRLGAQPLGVHVDPLFVEAEVLALHTEQFAYPAAAAVGGDHIAGPDAVVRSVRTHGVGVPAAQTQGDTVVVLVEAGDRPALTDVDGAVTAQPLVHRALHIRLVHGDVVRIPHRALGARRDIHEGLALAVDPQVLARGRVPQRLVDIACRLNGPGGLVVDVSEPGQPVQGRPALTDHHPVAESAEQRRRGESGRTVADDGDVIVRSHPTPPETAPRRCEGSWWEGREARLDCAVHPAASCEYTVCVNPDSHYLVKRDSHNGNMDVKSPVDKLRK